MFEDLVQDVNKEFRKMHEEAVNEKHSPMIARILEQLIRFTDVDEINAAKIDPRKSEARTQTVDSRSLAQRQSDWDDARPKL